MLMRVVLVALLLVTLAAVEAVHIKDVLRAEKNDCFSNTFNSGCQGGGAGGRRVKPKMVDSLECEKTNSCCDASKACNNTQAQPAAAAGANSTATPSPQPVANKQEQVLQPSPAQPQASTTATPQAVQVKQPSPSAVATPSASTQPAPPAPSPLVASQPQNATGGPASSRENKVITHIAVSMNNRNIIHAKQNQASSEDHQDGSDMAAAAGNNAHPTAPEKTAAATANPTN